MTQLEIGKTYHRKEPGGREITFEIKTPEDLKYHQSLVEKGYSYELFAKKEKLEANQ